jgi:phosphoribosyl 1,2-cyclic phosphate phosphodiesterase
MSSITFLGTGDSMGVPRVYCDCGVCEEARASGRNRRFRSSVWIETDEEPLLLDCGPDWTSQMEQLGKRFVENVLITHAHHDHIGGLPEWADACRWLRRKGNAYAPQEVIETVLARYPWLDRFIHFHQVDEGMEYGGWQIRPWKVCHGKNGHAFAYHFSRERFRWVYCSDSIDLTDEQKSPLYDLDLLVLGTNFYKEEAARGTRSVYDMTEALELLDQVRPKRALFTHLSHGVDAAEAYPLPPYVELAVQGETYRLQE